MPAHLPSWGSRSLICGVLISLAAAAASKPHEHGTVRLDVSIEGPQLTIAMTAALDNWLGFERAPRTDAERKAARTKPPQLYQVVMLNDDYTPMEFVVMVLQHYFQRDPDSATLIMLKIHHEGRGICGVYTKDVAATKVELVLTAARREGHPLQCIMEAA
jgi:ATP-dependent Clp protease adaptor protein ClpS